MLPLVIHLSHPLSCIHIAPESSPRPWGSLGAGLCKLIGGKLSMHQGKQLPPETPADPSTQSSPMQKCVIHLETHPGSSFPSSLGGLGSHNKVVKHEKAQDETLLQIIQLPLLESGDPARNQDGLSRNQPQTI